MSHVAISEVETKSVPVAEIFGPTLQGEGALAGMPTYFLRVGGCDFGCYWCDSDHAVNPANVRKLTRLFPDQIVTDLMLRAGEHPGPRWLTISGGNPALYDLSTVVRAWQTAESQYGWVGKVAVETQGTRWQKWLGDVNLLTVSPKAPSSGMTIKNGVSDFLEYAGDAWSVWLAKSIDSGEDPLDHKTVLKVVVFDTADYEWARDLHVRYPLIPFYLSCGTAMGGLSGKWVPPPIPGEYHDRFREQRNHPDMNWTPRSYVDTNENLLRRYRWLAETAMADPAMADVAVFPQMHCLLWGIETRGV